LEWKALTIISSDLQYKSNLVMQ